MIEGSAGFQTIELFDEEMGMAFPVILLYPSSSPEAPGAFGTYTMSTARDGSIMAGLYPLVVISHGTGGTPLVYRTLAAHLARNGFVVAMPEHPRNNRNNNDLAGTAALLAHRPRHVRLVIDWALTSSEFGPHVKADAVAVVGHSLGGYTALALAGGKPTAFPNETPDRKPLKIEVTADARVKALVLLAPAAAWFLAPGSLSEVCLPILMLTAEKDIHTPKWHAEVIRHGVPDQSLVEHRVIANAGHFSFLSPFPAAMASPSFPPSQDPAGFDRERFHEELNSEVLAFLTRTTSGRH